jgi:hypothetical protein
VNEESNIDAKMVIMSGLSDFRNKVSRIEPMGFLPSQAGPDVAK